MAIEIVDSPIKSIVIFHSYVNVYQRVEVVPYPYPWIQRFSSYPRSVERIRWCGAGTRPLAALFAGNCAMFVLVKSPCVAIENHHL